MLVELQLEEIIAKEWLAKENFAEFIFSKNKFRKFTILLADSQKRNSKN